MMTEVEIMGAKITEMETDELIQLGARLRGGQLVTQAGYTAGIAAEDGEPLKDILPDGYIEAVAAASAAVDAAAGDRTNMEQEAKDATGGQNTALRDAKVWRRKVASRGRAMRRLGHKIPDTLVTITASRTVAPVLKQIGKMTAALRKNLAGMGKKPQVLLDEGVRLQAALSTADADQEVKRLSTLPAKVRDYYAAKGRLYVGLKVINDAGHELHAGDADAAGRYNLKLLYRRGTKAGDKPSGKAGGAGDAPANG